MARRACVGKESAPSEAARERRVRARAPEPRKPTGRRRRILRRAARVDKRLRS